MTTRDQEQAPHSDLEQFQRSLKLLTPDPSDEGALEIMRMYLPVANGDTQPNPTLMPALEAVAGGSLCVGTMPVRSKDGVPDANDLRWCERLMKTVALHLKYGFALSPRTPEGRWLWRQRYESQTQALSRERRLSLDKALSGWQASTFDEQFYRSLKKAREAFDRIGSTPLQDTFEGRWLSSRRSELRKGELSTDRKAKLDAAIPGWSDVGDLDVQFARGLARVAKAFEQDGVFPSRHTPDGKWLSARRSELSKGSLLPDRKAKLDAEIPGWSMSRSEQFDRTLARTTRIFKRDGALPSASSFEGRWLHTNRARYSRGELPADRKAKLDAAIPGWSVGSQDSQFDRSLLRTLRVLKQGEQFPSIRTFEGRWLSTRRTELRKGKLSTDRKAKLDAAIPGWSDVGDLDAQFVEKLERATQVFSRDGTITAGTSEGRWLSRQRIDLRNGTISSDRKAKLDAAIPGWSDVGDLDAQFARGLERAATAFKRSGALPPVSTSEGQWLSSRRSELRKGELSTDRKAKLDAAIPGWSDVGDLDAQFARGLERAATAFKRSGALPPASTSEGQWLFHVRVKMRKGALSSERITRLDAAIPGWSTSRDLDVQFSRGLDALKQSIEMSQSVPTQRVAEGRWLSTQRQQFRRGTLSPERKAKLDEAFPLWLDPKAWRESLKRQSE